MSQASILSTMRSAVVAAAVIALIAISVLVRGAASPDGPILGRLDDFGTRYVSEPVSLGRLDDFGTRYVSGPVSLGRLDDFGTRHVSEPVSLGRLDDFGTRHGR